MKHHQCSPTLYTEEGSGDLQGDRRDDPDGGQERGRQDQLLGVQGDDGRPAPPHPRHHPLQVRKVRHHYHYHYHHHHYLQVSHGPHTADILGSVRARGPRHGRGEILDV